MVYCVPLSGCSSVWLECLLGVQEVACSSQVTPTIKKEAFCEPLFFVLFASNSGASLPRLEEFRGFEQNVARGTGNSPERVRADV